nr:DUF5991 domain-containing protein [uncultured Draconibacterium sp.]
MKQFPKLKEYSDDELIMIIYDGKEHWQKEAIVYAKKLLLSRGVTDEYSKERVKDIRKEIAVLWKQELKERETESYSIIDLVFMTLFWPKYIFWDWYLKKNGYYRMRNQRLIALGVGFLIYFVPTVYSISTYDEYEKERIAEINRQTEQDSIAISKIDWSGQYVFVDSSFHDSKKAQWTIDLVKEQGNHKGTLIIKNKNSSTNISCIGLIKDDLMEFYPDTTYDLVDGTKISYYDRLFTFGRDSLKIYTKWGKLNPYYSEKRKIEEYFELKNSM